MAPPDFHLQAHVDHLYQQPRKLAFQAQSPAEFERWQRELRGKVAELLGITGRKLPATVEARSITRTDRCSYTEEKLAIDTGEGTQTPLYVLVPKAEPPYKSILVFHGHNPSVHYVLGSYPDEETRVEHLARDINYAQALAQAGYLVCAVEQRGFGERTSDLHGDLERPNSCRHLSFEYLLQGRTLIGERCWDGMLALTYLQSRSDLIPGRFGCTGNSGGGTTTLWLAALDDRISVVVPACYFCSFKHSILGIHHCECNYVPGTLQYMEMGDLAALLAPRPLRIIAGEGDPIFPIEGVKEQFGIVTRAYRLLGERRNCSLAIHEGGHAYHHRLSQEWFQRWL